MEKVLWCELEFQIFPADRDLWPETAGLYIFAAQGVDSFRDKPWKPLYVGQTTNFASRLPNHEKLADAKRLGLSHIHLHEFPKGYDPDGAFLDDLEEMLLRELQHPLNFQ